MRIHSLWNSWIDSRGCFVPSRLPSHCHWVCFTLSVTRLTLGEKWWNVKSNNQWEVHLEVSPGQLLRWFQVELCPPQAWYSETSFHQYRMKSLHLHLFFFSSFLSVTPTKNILLFFWFKKQHLETRCFCSEQLFFLRPCQYVDGWMANVEAADWHPNAFPGHAEFNYRSNSTFHCDIDSKWWITLCIFHNDHFRLIRVQGLLFIVNV